MLQNNSNEMATVVETFLIEEVTELLHDNEQLDKWNAMVADLGLEGQKEIVQVGKSPIPFLWVNTGLKNVLKCLCPRSVTIEKFNLMPIPVEILSLVSLSKAEGYFRKIEVWYDDQQKDPCVVGFTATMIPMSLGYNWHREHPVNNEQEAIDWLKSVGKEPYNSTTATTLIDEKYYLIGKWADMKHSFAELREMATKRYIGETENKLNADIKKAQRELDDLKISAIDKFGSSATIDEYPF